MSNLKALSKANKFIKQLPERLQDPSLECFADNVVGLTWKNSKTNISLWFSENGNIDYAFYATEGKCTHKGFVPQKCCKSVSLMSKEILILLISNFKEYVK
ncbi:MAG: hypothetical protein ACJAW3_001337 [Lentimonas sp.]|jgi:hypothetical protein